MGWIGCVRCEKSRCDFVAWTLALIAIVHPILHRVSCIYEMIPNAPKHYTTHPNMSSGSNGADWVRLLRKIRTWLRGTKLRKIRTWLRGTNFFMNCTSSHRFALSFMQLQNQNKCTQTQWNLWKYEFRVQWGGLGAFIVKNSNVTSWHEFFLL